MSSEAVNFKASAAVSLCSQLPHNIVEQFSGDITEYHALFSISILSPTPIPRAPPDAPSPIIITIIGTDKDIISNIFLAIALGLALGADQREVAAVSVPLILGFISAIGFFTKENSSPTGNLLITVEVPRNDNENENLEDILKTVANICPTIEVRKIHQDNRIFTIVAIVNVNEPEILTKFSESFNSHYPNGRFTFIDDSSFPNE